MSFKKIIVLFLCIALIAAATLMLTGCKDQIGTESPKLEESGDKASGEASEEGTNTPSSPATEDGVTRLGEGETQFCFKVYDRDGKEKEFLISTDEQNVGDALLELGLIEGEEGPYGLYVKKVNGVRADFDTDGTYWAFYVNGEYAMSGVDTTNIEKGAEYAFKIEG